MKMKNFKRTIALLTASLFVLGSTFSVFASDADVDHAVPQEKSATSEVTPRASTIVAFDSRGFSGSHGEVPVYLDSNLVGANFSCAVNGDASGSYYCTVKLPNGTVKELGWVNGNGQGTNKDNLWLAYAGKGTYTFYCNGTGGNNLTIMGTIYD